MLHSAKKIHFLTFIHRVMQRDIQRSAFIICAVKECKTFQLGVILAYPLQLSPVHKLTLRQVQFTGLFRKMCAMNVYVQTKSTNVHN